MKKLSLLHYILPLVALVGLPFFQTHASSIDTGKVESAWLQWTNALRTGQNLTGYTIDSRLTTTAGEWSTTAMKRGYINHKRAAGDAYYDYNKIAKRFKNRGLVFTKRSGVTFSESIGYGYLSCKKTDCTEELIQATKTTRNMYMKEKNNKSRPHYNALVSKQFSLMGVGVVVDEKTKTYYITIHYGTHIEGDN